MPAPPWPDCSGPGIAGPWDVYVTRGSRCSVIGSSCCRGSRRRRSTAMAVAPELTSRPMKSASCSGLPMAPTPRGPRRTRFVPAAWSTYTPGRDALLTADGWERPVPGRRRRGPLRSPEELLRRASGRRTRRGGHQLRRPGARVVRAGRVSGTPRRVGPPPVTTGATARRRRLDWDRRRYGERVEVAPSPLLIVEGCGIGHEDLALYLSYPGWLTAPGSRMSVRSASASASIPRASSSARTRRSRNLFPAASDAQSKPRKHPRKSRPRSSGDRALVS